jgi:hypothetical protein
MLRKIKRRILAMVSLGGIVVAMIVCLVWFSCLEVIERSKRALKLLLPRR